MSGYRGRFAPSPTGPLHLGSLVAALASWLEARSRGGEWLVRMEDLDRGRARTAHADAMLRGLEHFGLFWDGPVLYQSARDAAYALAMEQINREGLIYPCTCTRSDLNLAQPGVEGPVYPGTCRDAPPLRAQRHSLRLRVEHTEIAFTDRIQGRCVQQLAHDVGDFILRRADGLFAYQLAVVVDDATQQITDIVRGADLLNSTPRQIHLQRLLNLPTPGYAHVPVLTSAGGRKLSKQETFDPITASRPEVALRRALELLGQDPPIQIDQRDALLEWAHQHWDMGRVPRVREVGVP